MSYYTIEDQKEIIFTPEYIQNKNELIGRIIMLMSDSDVYLGDSLYALKKNITAPIYSNKSLVYFAENKLVGYCSWAWLTEDSEKKYIANSNSLEIIDWGMGDRLWLIDVVAPYNSKHAYNLMKYVRKHVIAQGFKGTKVKFKRYYNVKDYKIQEVELC